MATKNKHKERANKSRSVRESAKASFFNSCMRYQYGIKAVKEGKQ